jgi:hypothetical protein
VPIQFQVDGGRVAGPNLERIVRSELLYVLGVDLTIER